MIGVLTAQLDDAYQSAVWRGIEGHARTRGVGVVSLLGRRIDSPVASEAAANVAFRIVDQRTVDGIIVISSAIATFLDRARMERLFATWAAVPLVSVGMEIPGVASVTVDGARGVAEVVRHLARDHGRSRFALIAGPAGHPEAEERALAFRAALEELGLPFDGRLATRGTFLRESGAEGARSLLASGLTFDALVCMNDRMALGAMEVLREAGRRIPADAAVVGFDGIEEGRYSTPPLTTVIQPLDELGAAAVEVLLDRIGGAAPANRALASTLAVRQSCGCPPRIGAGAEIPDPPPSATPAELEAMAELEGCARRSDAAGFVAALDGALSAAAVRGGEPSRWNELLDVVRRRVDGPQALFESARVLVGEVQARMQAARRVETEERLAALRATSASLAGAFELPVMLANLEAGLSRLGMGGGWLALFSGATTWSRLVMAPRGQGMPSLPPGGLRFRTARLLPARAGEAWKRGHWVFEPLVFQDEPLGYILLPGGVKEPAVYITLGEQVASALKGALLLEQVRTHERRLETEVSRRTAELTRANAELRREIERRMRLEREVTEISSSTMHRIGQDLHDDLCQHLAGIAMLVSVLRGELARSDSPAVPSIDRVGALLADSIARAKRMARGLYPAGLEEHGLASAVEELVGAARRSYPVTIEFRASPGLRLPGTDRALQVYRIVQEALTNALKHSGSDRIEVGLSLQGRRGRGEHGEPATLVAEVTDHGVGLPHSLPAEGMGMRIMRYRAETAGAELDFERLEPGTRVSCTIPIEGGKR
jgi:DNA-binding LacI/PurR family transcriptional regulator/signal transduction histidine kinase